MQDSLWLYASTMTVAQTVKVGTLKFGLPASLCSNFGIGGDDDSSAQAGPLLAPAGIAGIVLAGIVAVACIAALLGALKRLPHAA